MKTLIGIAFIVLIVAAGLIALGACIVSEKSGRRMDKIIENELNENQK